MGKTRHYHISIHKLPTSTFHFPETTLHSLTCVHCTLFSSDHHQFYYFFLFLFQHLFQILFQISCPQWTLKQNKIVPRMGSSVFYNYHFSPQPFEAKVTKRLLRIQINFFSRVTKLHQQNISLLRQESNQARIPLLDFFALFKKSITSHQTPLLATLTHKTRTHMSRRQHDVKIIISAFPRGPKNTRESCP